MHPGLPGAVGPVDVTATASPRRGRSETGAAASIAISERIHAAAAVLELPRAPGDDARGAGRRTGR